MNFSNTEFQLQLADVIIALDSRAISSKDLLDLKNTIDSLDELVGLETYKKAFFVDFMYKNMWYSNYYKNKDRSTFSSILEEDLSLLNSIVPFDVEVYKKHGLYLFTIGTSTTLFRSDNIRMCEEILSLLTEEHSIFLRIKCMKDLLTLYLINPHEYLTQLREVTTLLKQYTEQNKVAFDSLCDYVSISS